ncbi:P-loop containing nucleoside triphosphate hydrolase protein [Aspergillus minisclerotigenes]|uniref:P-loop containing nucleoside triphosphate hydrolase protein n=1 Tax=Aspergillus minisclerotigenes TaxID=656917 RepID=A0A5N6JCW4_9EURO|nr:P-loop containing nucleoside triphosphate hydrolase protein [Aspergillus minisclerotigenes]
MAKKKAPMLTNVDDMDNEGRVRLLAASIPADTVELVVVGDQSSGKSSLLEGLTGFSFPIASDLCTRYVTQIVLRRTKPEDSGTRITIIPGPSASDGHRESLLSFERSSQEEDLDSSEIADIFNEAMKAARHMGVPGPSTTDPEHFDKRFSDDILKIEISGPLQRHLSVVDVPGLFHNPTQYQTLEDRAIIRDLIEKYITDKRTIILAVMDARNNLANQEVFNMARSADPQGSRTVGIITKCDAVQEGDEENDKVIRIAQNEVEKLHHGWFVVRNRSTKEIQNGVTIEGRHHIESHFFSTEHPWTKLSKDRVGIKCLKLFLGGLLYSHIKGEFPGMVKEIEDLSQETQKEHVGNALSGNYDPTWDSNSPLKLRMHIHNLNELFAKDMAHYGHLKMFQTVSGDVDVSFHRSTGDQQNIYDWIRTLYRDSRGAELPGTVNPAVLENMFRQQSSPWEKIAQDYVVKASSKISDFIRMSLERIVGDDEVRASLMSQIVRRQTTTSTRAMEILSTILSDERGGILQTVNHYFADTLAETRQERVMARLRSLDLEGVPMNVTDVLRGIHLSNEEQAINDIHDILKAYYKLALKRFCDTVILQVTERCLLGQDAAIRFLSPALAGGMTDRELADVAEENFATSTIRNDLLSRIQRYQSALDIVRQVGGSTFRTPCVYHYDMRTSGIIQHYARPSVDIYLDLLPFMLLMYHVILVFSMSAIWLGNSPRFYIFS